MNQKQLTFVDLFAGIGGIRIGFESAGCKCVWSNDNNKQCARTYIENFGSNDFVLRDIREILSAEIPDFDILCAGFPCQPFSIAGVSKKKSLGKPHGFQDETQGTLFHEIVRILKEKRPLAFFLENVKNLERHDKGRTYTIMREALEGLGYSFYSRVINAKSIVPQNRERIFMVGFSDRQLDFRFPEIPDLRPKVEDILEREIPEKYTLTDHLWDYLQKYAEKHRQRGNGFGYGLVNLKGKTRTLSARYYKDGSEILIPQTGKNPRRLTPRECARLQGFSDSFKIVVSDTQAYKQFGNSVAVPVIEILAKALARTLREKPKATVPYSVQKTLAWPDEHTAKRSLVEEGDARLFLNIDESIGYMQSIMAGNKALGLLAQFDFEKWIESQGPSVRNKYLPGCWLLAPKNDDFYALRTCFFVWREVIQTKAVSDITQRLEGDRQFQSLCSCLNASSFDVIYCFPTCAGSVPTLHNIVWKIYRYGNERLVEQVPDRYFARWRGRGRKSRGKEWAPETVNKFKRLDERSLTALLLPQLFYNELFKTSFNAATMDPYDADGFIFSYDGKVFPIELKQKSPFKHQSIGRTFGVDAGRILMLLRLCLPADANAFYVVKEVDETPQRNLVDWNIIRLDEILMKCSWNTQAGGPGMASSAAGKGSQTSTILVPHRCFHKMSTDTFIDENLRDYSSLSQTAKKVAREFIKRMKDEDSKWQPSLM